MSIKDSGSNTVHSPDVRAVEPAIGGGRGFEQNSGEPENRLDSEGGRDLIPGNSALALGNDLASLRLVETNGLLGIVGSSHLRV